jgi:PIN domain nuclease of toxin-antitoxin system
MSKAAADAIERADDLAVASITWFELAWLAHHERIAGPMPVRAWQDELSDQVRTAVITPAVAAAAVALPDSFPRDPADRSIYATALSHGWPLITKDERLRRQRVPGKITLW